MLNIWQQCLQDLRNSLGPIAFETWIAPLNLKRIDENSIILEVPDIFFKQWLESNYYPQIKNSLKTVTTKEFTIQLNVNPNLLEKTTNKIFRSIHKSFKDHPQDSPGLNTRFTFDNFIVGGSNRMAHAACMAVAQAPGKSYNPLFIYGGVGLGKTHLMQAIANYILVQSPGIKVKYISSEKFTNELIVSIQNRSTQKFRQKYRSLETILIDDIQFLSGKEAVQEEFFHTFNELYDYHKQIVISSDRPPKEIPKLEERLVSRFSWGLVVDIQPPDYETRVAILRKKLEDEPIKIEGEVINFIAENITTNIRELEGALIRTIAYSLIENKPISLTLAQDILKDMVKEIYRRITPDIILGKVADYFSLEKGDLKKKKRNKTFVIPRQIGMYLVREFTDLSLPEIGNFFGAKHHTTILYGYKKIKAALKSDKNLKDIIHTLTHELKS